MKTKTESQHTPTPWELYQDEDIGHWFIWAKGNMAANIPRRIDGIDKANAEFIVRAVNNHKALLEAAKSYNALEQAIDVLNSLDKNATAKEVVHLCYELKNKLKNAIAQAEGE